MSARNTTPPPAVHRVQLPRGLCWICPSFDDLGVVLAGSGSGSGLLEELGVPWCRLSGNHGKYRKGVYSEEWVRLLYDVRMWPGNPAAVVRAVRRAAVEPEWRNVVLSVAYLSGSEPTVRRFVLGELGILDEPDAAEALGHGTLAPRSGDV